MWDAIMDLFQRADMSKPTSRMALIHFGVWTLDTTDPSKAAMAPEWCRALIILAWRKMYAAFAKVELAGRQYRWQSVYIQVLESLRGSLISRAVEMREVVAKHMHAQCEKIPVLASIEKVNKYDKLIEIRWPGQGKPWTIMPLLADEIEAAKTSLAARLEREKEIAAAQRYDAANRPHGKKRMRVAARQRPDFSLDPDSD